MAACKWNNKEDLVLEQALKHLKQDSQLFSAFTSSAKPELFLLNKIHAMTSKTSSSVLTRLFFYSTRLISQKVIQK